MKKFAEDMGSVSSAWHLSLKMNFKINNNNDNVVLIDLKNIFLNILMS